MLNKAEPDDWIARLRALEGMASWKEKRRSALWPLLLDVAEAAKMQDAIGDAGWRLTTTLSALRTAVEKERGHAEQG